MWLKETFHSDKYYPYHYKYSVLMAYEFVFDLLQFPFAFGFVCVNGTKVNLNGKLGIVILANTNPLIVYTQTATNNAQQRMCMAMFLWAKGTFSCIQFEIFYTLCRQLTGIISCIYHYNKINFAAKRIYCLLFDGRHMPNSVNATNN